jgi:N-methylhydantoinase A
MSLEGGGVILASASVGVDTGGTFTDLCWIENGTVRVHKVSSTPADPAVSVVEGLRRAPAGGSIVHGTTVATNALLEDRLARTALVTNVGFEDLVEIGRQARPALYDLEPPPPRPLVPPDLRFGIPGRLGPGGVVLEPLDPEELRNLVSRLRHAGVEAVAVGLLHAYADGSHERSVARALEATGLPVSLSHQVVREHREYERFVTTIVNAGLLPRMSAYLTRLGESLPGRPLAVMTSAGGTLGVEAAGRSPVQTLLSGPAGGVLGAVTMASLAGLERVLTLDMGGTSTDVALCPGRIPRTTEGTLGGLPVRLARVDLDTVGAGGGSLARRDAGGALQVGPRSAGADPGPAGYGRGGLEPTVTDAHLVLGRLGRAGLLGETLPLQPEASLEAVGRLGCDLGLDVMETAEGILRVAQATMERALRRISVERGHDPRDFALVAFGGAGPLHGAELAAALGVRRVLVPVHPGALSALGMVLGAPRRDLTATLLVDLDRVTAGEVESIFRELEDRGREELAGEGVRPRAMRRERRADLRYRGQSFELTVPWDEDPAAAFHQGHRKRYGLSREGEPVELVALRVAVTGPGIPPPFREAPPGESGPRAALVGEERAYLEGRERSLAVYRRDRLRPGHRVLGPARLTEFSATTLVPPGWEARVDGHGQLLLAPEGHA